MDTAEQLNGTYFYGVLNNLTAGELFFWIRGDVTAEHFTGAKDVITAAATLVAPDTKRPTMTGECPLRQLPPRFSLGVLYRLKPGVHASCRLAY